MKMKLVPILAAAVALLLSACSTTALPGAESHLALVGVEVTDAGVRLLDTHAAGDASFGAQRLVSQADLAVGFEVTQYPTQLPNKNYRAGFDIFFFNMPGVSQNCYQRPKVWLAEYASPHVVGGSYSATVLADVDGTPTFVGNDAPLMMADPGNSARFDMADTQSGAAPLFRGDFDALLEDGEQGYIHLDVESDVRGYQFFFFIDMLGC